uniref:C-type lectin n=1 Tax=Panulirus homarus TaxID=150425 RepID=A0A1B1SKX6_PANHM|nr:C-type lectin [Panulirus homarus]
MIRNILIFAVLSATYGDFVNYRIHQGPVILQRPQTQPVFNIPAPQPIFNIPAPQPVFTIPSPQPVFAQTNPRSFPASISRPSATTPIPQPICDPINKPLVDEIHNGRAYHFSWCRNYGQRYTWHDAVHYCNSLGNGFQAVSIEDKPEDDFIKYVLSIENIPHVWTSGNKLHSYYWTWQSNVNTGYTNWSHTGRRGLPQPDNDEQNENCLAVLNNHYNDGITWHDSRCDALKHVICEARQFYH